jgi:hypothetical protein
MKTTTAGELKANFRAGLAIAGENDEGELEWWFGGRDYESLESKHQRKLDEQFENEANDIKMAELEEVAKF